MAWSRVRRVSGFMMCGVGAAWIVATLLAGDQGQGTGARDRSPGADAGRGAPIRAANAIIGRVTDPDGHPMARVFVSALTPDATRQSRCLQRGSSILAAPQLDPGGGSPS
jgi:hypothetical protein